MCGTEEKGTDWRSYLTLGWKPFLQFIFFPLQFLFLYSNHPTGGMGSLPKRLVDDWEKRHRASAEASFAAKREGKQLQGPGPSFFAKVNASGEREKVPA